METKKVDSLKLSQPLLTHNYVNSENNFHYFYNSDEIANDTNLKPSLETFNNFKNDLKFEPQTLKISISSENNNNQFDSDAYKIEKGMYASSDSSIYFKDINTYNESFENDIISYRGNNEISVTDQFNLTDSYSPEFVNDYYFEQAPLNFQHIYVHSLAQTDELTQPFISQNGSIPTTISTPIKISKKDLQRKDKANKFFLTNSLKFPEVTPMTSVEILELYDIDSGKLKSKDHEVNLPENLLMIDCRTQDEQAYSIVQNAITLKEFEQKYMNTNSPSLTEEELDNTLFVPYCTVGFRSGKFSKQLLSSGFKNVRNNDGVLLWLHSGGKLVKVGSTRSDPIFTNYVHTFSDKLSLAPLSYKTQKAGFFKSIQNFFKKLFYKFTSFLS